MKFLLDRDVLLVFSNWFGNLSAGWFGSIFILPIFTDTQPWLLLTVHLPAAIITLALAIWLEKRSKK